MCRAIAAGGRNAVSVWDKNLTSRLFSGEMMNSMNLYYGRTPQTVESAIIGDFERIAYRKGLRIRAEEVETVRGFASAIAEHILGRGGAGRIEDGGRRYSARERDRNLDSALRLARRVAERAVERAREGKAEMIVEEMWIGSQRMQYRTTSSLFGLLCPPPLPPICN
jgi:hypothetical protein